MEKSQKQRWSRLFVFASLLFVCGFLIGTGNAGAKQGPPSTPPGIARGQAAIDALGDRLPDVAAEYGMTAVQLRNQFLNDHTLHVGRSGELFYVEDKFPGDTQASQAALDGPAAAPFPESSTFTLHSLPGADHTIYLDFDGHVTTGTSWNSNYLVTTINSPAYDIDGDATTFGASEHELIQTVWQMVSEDFRPFDVNVTTQDPGPAALSYQGGGDTQWGTRVVITDDTFADCGCGGHAFIGSFDDSQDEPVFVYNSSLMGVSEASSHEVGHAIRLSHDGLLGGTGYYQGHGSGETGWAPIMGVSYYKNVSQWSKGEYYNSNNAGPNGNYDNNPDDLDLITSLTNGNGFGYRPDDHGNNDGSAAQLGVSVGVVNDSGIIERTTDVDVFSFSAGAGAISLNITPFSPGPNLDVLAELYDSGGGLVTSSNPAGLLAASINTTVSAGTYYLHVDGAGFGDPLSSPPTGYTDYGSLGQYAISGTVVDPGGNHPPVFSSNPVVETNATEELGYASTLVDDVSDPDGDPLTFDTLTGPAWLSMASGGDLSGTPANDDVGLNVWTVQVSDDNGGSTQANLQITVINTNDAPTFNSDPIVEANGTEDAAYSGTLADDASDPDGDNLTFSKVSGPAWLAVAGDGTLSGNPTNGNVDLNSFAIEVSDGNGGLDQAALEITVEQKPPYVDQNATDEIFVSGSVSGNYLDTLTNDGTAEAITERTSGGKKNSRFSYFDHKWEFTVQSGTAITLTFNAWAPSSTDGDTFLLSYSADDSSYIPLGAITATIDDNIYQSFMLANDLSGTVYIRLEDSDRTAGYQSLDTVYVDHLFIRSNTVMPSLPGSPSGLGATAAGASQIDLGWTDGSSNELVFRIERSPTTLDQWAQVGEVGAGVITYSDMGLSPEKTYDYRVYAFNAAGPSVYSSVASATTEAAGSMHVWAMSGSPSPANRNRWNATVTITIYDDAEGGGAPVAGATVSGNWSAGANGGDSCVTDAAGECSVTRSNIKSNVGSVTFTVGDVLHPNNSYAAASNVFTSVNVLSP